MKRTDLIETFAFLLLGVAGLGLVLLWAVFNESGEHWLVPSTHITGTIVAFLFLIALLNRVSDWQKARRQNHLEQCALEARGVSLAENTDRERAEKAWLFTGQRYSYDLFRNRISNLLLYLNKGIDALGVIASLACFFVPIYFWWFGGENAQQDVVLCWFSVLVLALSSGIQIIIDIVSEFLFGRWPGEARWAHACLMPSLQRARSENKGGDL